MGKPFSDESISLIRKMPILYVLEKLSGHGHLFWKKDVDFVPDKDKRTMRLYVSFPSGTVKEMLVTDLKWFDVQLNKGGGGSIDLVMHLLGISFVASVKLLRQWTRIDDSATLKQ